MTRTFESNGMRTFAAAIMTVGLLVVSPGSPAAKSNVGVAVGVRGGHGGSAGSLRVGYSHGSHSGTAWGMGVGVGVGSYPGYTYRAPYCSWYGYRPPAYPYYGGGYSGFSAYYGNRHGHSQWGVSYRYSNRPYYGYYGVPYRGYPRAGVAYSYGRPYPSYPRAGAAYYVGVPAYGGYGAYYDGGVSISGSYRWGGGNGVAVGLTLPLAEGGGSQRPSMSDAIARGGPVERNPVLKRVWVPGRYEKGQDSSGGRVWVPGYWDYVPDTR